MNGAPGQGKTVFSQAIVRHLNTLLKPDEGRALARSLDDYYLSKAERYRPEFLGRGYNPEGIPNRGPAGTHDTGRLRNDLSALEQSRPDSSFALPVFDKQTDDASPEPCRVDGRVGVFLLEGWFVGARTDADPMRVPAGLKRSVASALKGYQAIFDRLDALWVFEPPRSLDDIVSWRMDQQATLNRETGKAGMTAAQIRGFMDYFYTDSWQDGVTSPVPPKAAASFWAMTDSRRRFLTISPSLST